MNPFLNNLAMSMQNSRELLEPIAKHLDVLKGKDLPGQHQITYDPWVNSIWVRVHHPEDGSKRVLTITADEDKGYTLIRHSTETNREERYDASNEQEVVQWLDYEVDRLTTHELDKLFGRYDQM